MSRPIEQALANLIPRHPGALPSELVELAGSLLAQSRNKCSNLKSEEEVARIYACANLACERLKTSLNLPPIEPRPPIPPRIYNKLYAYFDRTLTSSFARQRARNSNAAAKGKSSSTTNSSGKALPQRLTPSKAQSFEHFQSQRTAKRGLVFKGRKEKDERVPRWLGPVVRLLCARMETRGAVPHVLAGVESILCLPCPGGEMGKGREVEGRLQALVAAMWFLVVVRLRGVEGQGIESMVRKNLVREVLAGAREDEGVKEKVGSDEGAWIGWEEKVLEKDVNSWRKEIVGKGWRDLDWFKNVGEGVGVDGDGGEDRDEDGDVQMGENEEDVEFSGRRARPGTMIQEQYCVTREKREVYIEWRDMMLAHIEGLMADGYMERDDAEIDAQ
ncbi:hypothetical protein VTL71DRAFT_14351 [Oculimacula yallundae]|uniref:ORC6 first cyclin-like domain-containing protein n=1 Tax=Oculimacula yallundae TaxID=86028 RepID=A0ABR4CIX3_9HELO